MRETRHLLSVDDVQNEQAAGPKHRSFGMARLLEKNRLYEVLGLFALLLVGAKLLAEGGHIAKLSFFGYSITLMVKSTFYFSLGTLNYG